MIALERDESATALVQRVMSDWIASYDAEQKLLAGSAVALRDNHSAAKPIARVVSVETTADGVTVEALPWDQRSKEDVAAQAAELAAKAAELAAAKGREFHPVPKPVRKPRPKR